MDIRIFIGACLLLATVANVSVSGEDATLNFCQEAFERYRLKWPEILGEDYSRLDELNKIPEDKRADYRKSIEDLPAKKGRCLDFLQPHISVHECAELLKSSSAITEVELDEAWGTKAYFVCTNIYLADENDLVAQILKPREPLKEFCNDTLASLYKRWIQLFEKNEFVIAVSAKYPSYNSWTEISDHEWLDNIRSDPDHSLGDGKRMCREFEKMDEVATYCVASKISSNLLGERIRSVCNKILHH